MNSVLAQARHPKLRVTGKSKGLILSMTMVQVDTEQRARDQDQLLSHPFYSNSLPEPSYITREFVLFSDLLWAHADVILSRSESPAGKDSLTQISNTYPGIRLP